MAEEGEEAASEPLLIASLSDLTYSQLVYLLEHMPFSTNRQTLHPELCRRVADFFVIQPVQPDQVTVVGCSSSDGVHPVAACLTPDESTWWISGADSMPRGKGREYVEFQLSPQPLVRLNAVSLKIPPLPAGPLSVRDFELQAPDAQGVWTAVSPVFRLQNIAGMQRFELPEKLDLIKVRVVCLSNQLSDFYNEQMFGFTYQRVGYYTVRFE